MLDKGKDLEGEDIAKIARDFFIGTLNGRKLLDVILEQSLLYNTEYTGEESDLKFNAGRRYMGAWFLSLLGKTPKSHAKEELDLDAEDYTLDEEDLETEKDE